MLSPPRLKPTHLLNHSARLKPCPSELFHTGENLLVERKAERWKPMNYLNPRLSALIRGELFSFPANAIFGVFHNHTGFSELIANRVRPGEIAIVSRGVSFGDQRLHLLI